MIDRFGLSGIDLTVLVVYLIGITMLGLAMARTIKDMDEFFMPRRYRWWMLITFSFGAGTHSDQAVGVASKTYQAGLSGIWYQWLYLFVTPFYWLIAPVLRRTRAITTADVFELRFRHYTGVLYTIVGSAYLIFALGIMLRGSGEIIEGSSGGQIDATLAVIVLTVLFVIYGMAGGLSAAIVTDFVQGLLTIVFSFMLLPPIYDAVGGMEGMRDTIADPSFFSLVVPGEINVFYISVISLVALIGIPTQPHHMGVCSAGRTELDGQIGFMFGNFTKRFCTIAWTLTGLAAVAYFSARYEVIDPDEIYGRMARNMLPDLAPGLLGLFLASLLASIMSSSDALMVSTSGLITKNIYREFKSGESERHYLWAGRLFSLVVVVGAIGCAFIGDDIPTMLEVLWKMPAFVGIPFLMGIFWRRFNGPGCWAAVLTGIVIAALTETALFTGWMVNLPFSEALNFVRYDEAGLPLSIYLPWGMVFFVVAEFVVGIAVTLMTAPPDPADTERFYTLIRTPVDRAEDSPAIPCTLPEGVEPAPDDNLVPGTPFYIPSPSRRAVTGVLVGIVIVIAMVWGFIAYIEGAGS